MGTRNLICVVVDGEYKIAQYGQWDGHPEGQGADILDFLRHVRSIDTFKSRVRNLSWLTEDDAEEIENKHGDNWPNVYPELSRDTGSQILNMVWLETAKKMQNAVEFAADSVFCEFCYVIDLDAGMLEVYRGFNRSPLSEGERFYFLQESVRDNGYFPVKKVIEYKLSDLPQNDDFVSGVTEACGYDENEA